MVGGEISGLSTALHLAQAGANVVVLERGKLGAGASGRSGGQVIPGLKRDPDDLLRTFGADIAEPWIAFVARRTADDLFDLVSRYEINCDPIRHGWIQCAYNASAVRIIFMTARANGLNEARQLINSQAPISCDLQAPPSMPAAGAIAGAVAFTH